MEDDVRTLIDAMEQRKSWPIGWNGYDSLPPEERHVEYAKKWIASMNSVIRDNHLVWMDPNISPCGWPMVGWCSNGGVRTGES